MIDGNAFTSLMGDKPGGEFWRWGTVQDVDPLSVLLDGDRDPLRGDFDSLTDLHAGDRALVHCVNRHLTVIGTRTFDTGSGGGSAAGLAAYPVGAFYWSANPTDPGELFGGRWRRVEGVFLYAASWRHGAGETGGEEKHTLSLDEIPAHRHRVGTTHGSAGYGGVGWYQSNVGGGSGWFVATTSGSGAPGTMVTEIKGGGAAHNNMPPFLAAYCWQRIA